MKYMTKKKCAQHAQLCHVLTEIHCIFVVVTQFSSCHACMQFIVFDGQQFHVFFFLSFFHDVWTLLAFHFIFNYAILSAKSAKKIKHTIQWPQNWREHDQTEAKKKSPKKMRRKKKTSCSNLSCCGVHTVWPWSHGNRDAQKRECN